MSVRIETNLGSLTFNLHVKEAPNTCRNFIKLCKISYYNWCIFHRVERDFVAQSGDPTGTGNDGQSFDSIVNVQNPKYFKDEISGRLRHDGKGVLAMANSGKDRNGSQFYVTLSERPLDFLDEKHTIFGRVTEGLEVLDKINNAFLDEKERPLEDVYIKRAVILEDPFPDPPKMPSITNSPPPSKVFLEMRRSGLNPDEIDHTAPEIDPELQKRREESHARAVTLEILGERPSADLPPPENVLFVCKLNPVTESDDLCTIFSRFGAVRSCDIIKDRRSGGSLGYAFIEFAEKEACEEAYLKMNNVLIDDRRIKVDFSQSISKLHQQWASNRRGGEKVEARGSYREQKHDRLDSDRDGDYDRRGRDRDHGRRSRDGDYGRYDRDKTCGYGRDSNRRHERSRSPGRH
jgi:peptidyl-prolyl cis-trans isomerase-like 4